jgi:chromosome partitioning protein
MLITIINQKGGVGKSTVAVHLAGWLERQGLRVAVIDADGQAYSASYLKRAAPKILCLSAVEATAIAAAVGELRAEHDYIVADAPPGLNDQALALVFLADLLIVPTQPSLPDLRATAQALKVISRTADNRPGRPLSVKAFLNLKKDGRRRTTQMAERVAIEQAGVYLGMAVGDRDAFRLAAVDGKFVWQLGRSAADATREIESLFTEIMGDGFGQRSNVGGAGDGHGGTEGRVAGPGAAGEGEAGAAGGRGHDAGPGAAQEAQAATA